MLLLNLFLQLPLLYDQETNRDTLRCYIVCGVSEIVCFGVPEVLNTIIGFLWHTEVRNWYVAELRHAEQMYYLWFGGRLSDNDLQKSPHHWWSTAKGACGLQLQNIIPPLHTSGKVYLSAREKADCLNAMFAAQCSAPAAQKLPPVKELSASFSFEPISASDVFKSLSSVNVWKAPGLDDVSQHLLKECAEGIAELLCNIFNLSLHLPGSMEICSCATYLQAVR